MTEAAYQYTAQLTRNPFRYALALWRVIRDPGNGHEVKIVEIGFACSRFGRRFARWHAVADALRSDARTAQRLHQPRLSGPIEGPMCLC